jgi:hypothetical protein
MLLTWKLRVFPLVLIGIALIESVAQAQPRGDRARTGFVDLSREMRTCAAYFALLSSVIENSKTSPPNLELARRIKSKSTAMLIHAFNIANYIGLGGDVVTERVNEALKEMVDTVNGDPPNSMQIMGAKYGKPCDELLENAPRRFVDLLDERRDEF